RDEEREGEDERELRPDEEPVEQRHVDRRTEEREEVSEDDEERDAESSDVRSAPAKRGIAVLPEDLECAIRPAVALLPQRAPRRWDLRPGARVGDRPHEVAALADRH